MSNKSTSKTDKMNQGWIKLHRSTLDHWIWQDERHFRWWITILLYVNHADSKFPVSGELMMCKSGESFMSIEGWMSLFRCSKPTVLKFFELLENDGMIMRKTVGKGNRRKHLLSVVNWEKYQQIETKNFTRTKPETLPKENPNVPPNKNDKNERMKEIYKFLLQKISIHFDPADISEESWLNTIRLLVENDKYTEDEILKVVEWGRNDSFWKSNFQSILKLRRKNKDGISYMKIFLEKTKSQKGTNVYSKPIPFAGTKYEGMVF